jgi:beta-lactam-binding protein with PASTA domain
MKRFYNYKTTLLFISLAMSLSILFGFSMVRNVSIETPIRIVDFTSMTQDQLLAWSQENDIKIVTEEVYDDTVEVGKVLSQNVFIGERLFAGSTVKVTLSKGPNPDVMVTLIDFTGKDIGEIQQFIETNKLLAATIGFEKSTEVGSAYFIRLDTTSTSVKRGQAFKFFISTGSKDELTTVLVPDFTEYTRTQISTWGATNNIKTNFIDEFNNDKASGKVISQSQAANTQVYDGSSITVKLSLGAGVVLENMVGKSKSTIDKFINDNGLKVIYSYTYSSSQNKDLGLSMSPSASTKVGNGSTVNITLSLGKISVTDFKGKTLAQLQAWVVEVNNQGADLKVTSSQEYSEGTSSGLIITQTPSSGDINPGATIKASVSKGEGIVVGTYKGTSNTSVQEGLKLNKVEVYSNSASGSVIEQSPSAGSKVDNGSTITLTVSIGKPSISSFVGSSPSDFQSQINTLNNKGAGLSISKSGDAYDNSTNIASGRIFSQSTSGTINVGSQITYVLSMGRSIEVPTYTACTNLNGSDLLENCVQVDSSLPAGTVVSQSPSAGEVVAVGSTVTIRTSKGPPAQVRVPDVGWVSSASSSESETRSIITQIFANAGVKVSIVAVNEDLSNGDVISVSHAADTLVDPSTIVTVRIQIQVN